MNNKIAVIGLSCLFPGAATPEGYWHNLSSGLDTTSLATAEQFGVDPGEFYDPTRQKPDTTYSLRGGYVRETIDNLDADKTSRWTVYAAHEALRDAGYLQREGWQARCGVILGSLSFPTSESQQAIAPLYRRALESAIAELTSINDFRLPHLEAALPLPGSLSAPASFAARKLGLGGAAFAIDAACASSLYAIGLACAYLNSGEADLMLAGAVSAADPLFVNMGFTHFGAYPERGASRPLDADSEGLIAGEGAAMLLLKRYADAVRDGDTIHAVVAGFGLSNDGRGKHPLTPNSNGQILAFQRAYQRGLNPRAVQYIECHASGTPLGDKTELQSMDEFFGAVNTAPRIGSVKANHGHLLTAAGLASVIKVILSMRHGMIPATIGVGNPLTSARFGAAQIVRENTAWTEPEKTAGVNAFGFGGVSAHLVLQNAAAAQVSPAPPRAAPTTLPKLAIVGMDAHFGGADGLESFAQTIYDGTQYFIPLPPWRWKGLKDNAPIGAYIEQFEIDFLRFKFPPKEEDQPTPQHLLLLKVADNAVQDAGLAPNSNVAVIVVLGTELSLHQYRARLDLGWQIREGLAAHGSSVDPDALASIVRDALSPLAQVNQYTSYIGNIVSSRVSALWNFSGPAFTLSAAETGVYKALEVAQLLLADGSLDAVVVGAVDLAGGVENVMLWADEIAQNQSAPTLTFDSRSSGRTPGEGAGAVVLRRADRVDGGRVYATIESIATDSYESAENTFDHTIEQALTKAGISAAQIGYLEASADGVFITNTIEINALQRQYQKAADTPSTALGSVKVNVGSTGAASGMASLIKTALLLQRRFIPATPHWTAPRSPKQWEDSAFYVPAHSHTWFSPKGTLRYAAINGLGDDGSCAHVILSDANVPSPTATGSPYLKRKALHLFPIDGDSREAILQRLEAFAAAIEGGDQALGALARETAAAFGNERYALVIVGRDRDALRREIGLALTGVPQAFDRGGDWHTPAGSAFSANPLGADGGIAFVYPGAFNSYPEHGRDWLHLFPSLMHIRQLGTDVGDQAGETLLYPRHLATPDRAQIRADRARLIQNQGAMMESGILFAVLYTHVMREVFRVRPTITFGYSLGESSMLWAMDVWQDSDSARVQLQQSPLFHTRLAGRKEAAREAWGLPNAVGDDFWASYVLAASASAVADAITHEAHVYLTHINTPNEVVIAGDPEACGRIIARLKCESIRAPFETVIHNDAILSEYEAFYHLYDLPISASQKDITFYSAADYAPMRMERAPIARSVARMSLKQVDFPRLIHRAYEDGARIFIELGPGSTCARWISDTLRGEKRNHLTVSIDAMRSDDHTALVRMLARLVSHRVPLDLSVLYEDAPPANARKRLPRMITLGGEPVRSLILSAANRQRFRDRAPRETVRPVARVEQAASLPVRAPAYGHDAALQSRLSGLREIGASLLAQVAGAVGSPAVTLAPPAPTIVTPTVAPPAIMTPPPVVVRYAPRPALFDTATIDQFARGRIANCYGPEYAIYDDRRAPRIPNTDLMLVTRVVEMNAERIVTKTGSSMVAEYDVPADAWFYTDNAYPFTPYSMLMEMALQPCGFLSAFMGPTLAFPDIDFYFRNLDGKGKLLRDVDLRGRTLVNRVELISSTILQGIIIQKYTFNMTLDGESFYVGSSTFGYFTQQSLSSQAGLDMGSPPAKWHDANPGAPLIRLHGSDPALHRPSWMSLPVDQLAFLDDAIIDVSGGQHGQGYGYATKTVSPADWYFSRHFYQDPVMPGSLGLETIIQAIQAYALQAGLDKGLRAPRFGHVEGVEAAWKYRGQVLSDTPAVNVEIHIKSVTRGDSGIDITANASLWKGALRIYEFKDVGVRVLDTLQTGEAP